MVSAFQRSQVPSGVQCFVGAAARRRRAIEETTVSVFEGWDYEEIIPPLFDYADVFASPALSGKTYSFVGRDGSLLALRPDFTSLIAKLAAGRLADRPAPLRLYYSGEVLRYEPPKAGRQSELYQMGLEHLGGAARAADVEVLAVAVECLERLDVRGAVLALGHVGVFAGLLAEAGLSADAVERLRERVDAKDPAGAAETLDRAGIGGPTRQAVLRLTALGGDAGVLDEAARVFAGFPAAVAALAELRETVEALHGAGLGRAVTVDLAEVRGLDYYTGLVFRVYAPDLGFELGAGGRYDTLLARFGRPMPAIGFMLGLDRVALLLERQAREVASAAAPDTIDTKRLGTALVEARTRRASGRRVHFGAGGGA
jgi:ATP phosphoribosyltransferase regulatory subunit